MHLPATAVPAPWLHASRCLWRTNRPRRACSRSVLGAHMVLLPGEAFHSGTWRRRVAERHPDTDRARTPILSSRAATARSLRRHAKHEKRRKQPLIRREESPRSAGRRTPWFPAARQGPASARPSWPAPGRSRLKSPCRQRPGERSRNGARANPAASPPAAVASADRFRSRALPRVRRHPLSPRARSNPAIAHGCAYTGLALILPRVRPTWRSAEA